MRLLEFENVDSGSSPQAARVTGKPAAHPSQKIHAPRQARTPTPPPGQVFALHDNPSVPQPVRRQPIDIEQLQERIEVLERRLRLRARDNDSPLPIKDLEQLKQRMKLLERSVHSELWAARQREHTLLEMLARPPLKQLVRDRARRLRSHTLPATREWCVAAGQNWWEENKPLWWPRFASAWQESLDKARGNYNT
jgi:hypothetical protein